MKTYSPKAEAIRRDWYVLDLEGKNLGRTAAEIAKVLTGKNKPVYSPHMDMGDFVVVVNAGKFAVTGKRMTQKKYRRHSGYPGGLKEATMKDVLNKTPLRILYLAVRGMLPKNKLRDKRMKRLKLYTSSEHPHGAQKPVAMKI